MKNGKKNAKKILKLCLVPPYDVAIKIELSNETFITVSY